ncbi:MAG: carboxypeptidase regulatory-like domain-containing protein [Armatimonadetes bacterium]|nr:carboxypeptidase regulatory-like domain-containing protein [Armatimonadota bacterium]
MQSIWRVKIVVLVAMSMTGAAWAAETGTIKGTVLDSSGKGLRGTIVSAIDEDNQKSISVLTDPEGRFILDQLPPNLYVVRARLVGFEDNFTDELEIVAGEGNKDAKFVMEPAKDLLLQRTGTSLFGELKIEDEAQRMSFKMSCTYCHQLGTWGFRTPEEPVDWEVMITRMDGFGALVNYHMLDAKLLDRLIYTYLGDWIKRQEQAVAQDESGADARLLAAQQLQEKLKLIAEGEPPYDIFVRWKPIEEQAVGWNPDLNDGVRMNIRPFIEANILSMLRDKYSMRIPSNCLHT